jgi:hypothetical protein
MRRVGCPQRRPPHRSLLHEPLSRPGPRRLTFCAVPGVLAMEIAVVGTAEDPAGNNQETRHRMGHGITTEMKTGSHLIRGYCRWCRRGSSG